MNNKKNIHTKNHGKYKDANNNLSFYKNNMDNSTMTTYNHVNHVSTINNQHNPNQFNSWLLFPYMKSILISGTLVTMMVFTILLTTYFIKS